MLPVTAIQNCTPVAFVIFLKACYLAVHSYLVGKDATESRSHREFKRNFCLSYLSVSVPLWPLPLTYPELVRLPDVGRHQRRIESVIKKQMADAITSGSNTE